MEPEYRFKPPIERFEDDSEIMHKPRSRKQRQQLEAAKNMFFVYNFFFFIFACVLLGIGIWIAADRAYMATIMSNSLYAVAAYIIIAAGGIMFLVTFLACCGTVSENKTLLKVFFCCVAFVCLICLIAGILAFVFQAQLGDYVRDAMRKTLREKYGVDLQNRWNRAVTTAWDKAQERLRCCAVDENGFQVYRDTQWFKEYGANEANTGQQLAREDDLRPYVPKSCCVKDSRWRYLALEACQTWTFGPPGKVDGARNPNLYFYGCYNRGKDFVLENSLILGIFGITFAVFMAIGLFCSCFLIRKIP